MNRGGCERHLLEVLPAIEVDRFEIEIFLLFERGELSSEMEARGIRVHGPWVSSEKGRNPWLRCLGMAVVSLQLWLHFLIRRPHIAHFFLPASYLIGAPVAIAAGIRRRVMSRRSLNVYQQGRPVVSAMERALHRMTTAFVGNCRRIARQLIDEENVPAARTTVIYNGVRVPPMPTREERERKRAALNVTRDAFVMVIVANLIPYKDHETLLRACALLQSRHAGEWTLLVIGRDDGVGGNLRRLAAELGIAPNVRFLGERDDVVSILPACDLGLLVSRQEGFSNALLECMAAGLPMLVTDVGGNPEAVREGVTGCIVPAGDESAMADRIAAFAQDAERRRAMGLAGRDRVDSHFGIDRCVSDYEKLYSDIAADGFRGNIPPLAEREG